MANNKNSKKKPAPPKNGGGEASIFEKFRREIWGVGCLVLAIVILLSNFDRSSVIARLFSGLFGQAGLTVLPIGLLLCFIALVFHGGRPVTMRIFCSLSFVLLACAISHLARSTGVTWGMDLIGKLYTEGKEGASGGVFGGLIAELFSLLGGRPVAWVLSIGLLLVALPSSLNLTLTGLLRAINNRREKRRQELADSDQEPEQYREPAEVLVEHVAQRREAHTKHAAERQKANTERKQQREELRQAQLRQDNESQQPAAPQKPTGGRQRKRFDFDLPVDDPPSVEQKPADQPKKKRDVLPFLDPQGDDAGQTVKPRQYAFDVEQTSLGPDTPTETVPVRPAPAPTVAAAQKTAAEQKAPQTAAPPAAVKQPEKNKANDTALAEAEISNEIAQAAGEKQLNYEYPPSDLLDKPRDDSFDVETEMREMTRRLQEKLDCFGVDAEIINVIRGPSITLFELQLAQGVRFKSITGLSDDIALAFGAASVRIAAIPDRNSVVGIEVPNRSVSVVRIREVIDSQTFRGAKSNLSFAVGKDISGTCIVGDISKMPHVLIAGTTGSGKSVCMNSLIVSLLYRASPEDVKLIMVDPKVVEFSGYNGIPHLLVPVVTDPKKAAGALKWAVSEMNRRYNIFSEAGAKQLAVYNEIAKERPTEFKHMPQIVILIDELADLMLVAGKEVDGAIQSIAQKGRASGIHLVIATQRPSADVITGLMKANIPSRIAFAVSSAMESRIILDSPGAENLIGRGDMLFSLPGKGNAKRVQGCLISDKEVERVVQFVKEHSNPNYSETVQKQIEAQMVSNGKTPAAAEPTDEVELDELLPAAVEVVLEAKQASTSKLQRSLKLGYGRAARIVDQMEELGIVGPFEGSKPRLLLINRQQWEEMKQSGALGSAVARSAVVSAPGDDLAANPVYELPEDPADDPVEDPPGEDALV